MRPSNFGPDEETADVEPAGDGVLVQAEGASSNDLPRDTVSFSHVNLAGGLRQKDLIPFLSRS